ncbi:MAG TPA: TonB-dependent receptor [Caulobacteraceae bacterium]
MSRFTTMLLAGAAAAALSYAPALAQEIQHFDIPAQDAAFALNEYARQAGVQIVFPYKAVQGRTTRQVQGDLTPEAALAMLTDGMGLSVSTDRPGMITLRATDGPQSGSAAGGGAEVEALIVTAQKREEDIQDVPIAISAFTQEALEEQKIEGGFDLLKAIPNVTFSKNNFTSYNFSIRGIGTKAVSATTDPGVAVAFNNTPLLQNRLFEQEYFDVERVEVLRGPQGTLYGRNATAGVINVISAKPDMDDFKGWVKGEVGNYHSKRAQAMVNIPIIEDKLAVRIAGAFTDRQGYDFNALTNNAVNGRDLWSARLTVAFNPTERIRSNLIWERFNEDDNRSRTGKQLCHRDNGPTDLNGTPLFVEDNFGDDYEAVMRPALFSQGCKPGSLYDDSAFGTPNGLALPFVFGMIALGAGCTTCLNPLFSLGYDPAHGYGITLIDLKDPYASKTQSTDLRVIESIRDPKYRAKADIVELNLDVDLTDHLTFTSQTAYNEDSTYSFQDFNRFNTQPIFNDTSNLMRYGFDPTQNPTFGPYFPSANRNFAPGGVFCDPQLGCTDRLVGFDIAQGKGTQFSQEFRLQSDLDGPINFSVGANYTRFKTLIDYYVFYNLITAYALMGPFNDFSQVAPVNSSEFGSVTPSICGFGTDFFVNSGPGVVTGDDPLAICPYIDPNPIESINGEGHNYFRSKNPYKVKSAAAFGELYWQATDALKVTAGLRYTDDRKTFIPVPSQVLLAPGFVAGGDVNRGYPEKEPIKQHWGEWTGRLGVDWKPDLSFTDQTMLYAFYSRGYKGGGANPPQPGFATLEEYEAQVERYGIPADIVEQFAQFGFFPILQLTGVEYGRTFEPEFVDAFEVGAKNTLLNGALQFNAGAFFYDYKDYQVSQIRDRTAVNENFDAQVWGLEFETMFSPSRNFQLIANLGYLDTKIADGETSIDIMDRTAGHVGPDGQPDFVVTKPWPQLPSNCVVPMGVAQNYVTGQDNLVGFWDLCGGVGGILSGLTTFELNDPATGELYDPAYYDGTDGRVNLNGGAGIAKELRGNELPNSPHWTMNIGAQYGMDFLEDWRVTVRGDAYWQSQSWARVYNDDPYDKLHGWYNVNLSVWFEKPDQDLKIELYAKNLLDKTPITDAFLNSDDTALTTNVFVLDPRLIGLSIRKGF